MENWGKIINNDAIDIELNNKIKSLINHEINILKIILGVTSLKNNDKIIIRFIDDDKQFYFKHNIENFHYDRIVSEFKQNFIFQDYIVMDIIIQIKE